MTKRAGLALIHKQKWKIHHGSSTALTTLGLKTFSPRSYVILTTSLSALLMLVSVFWEHGGIGIKVTKDKPLVLGHEASGVVHAVGSAVTSLEVGDRVAIEPGFPCRRCRNCKKGTYNLCSDMKLAAAPPDIHGTLTKFFAAPEDFIYKIPSTMSLQEAVVLEPLAVAVHAISLLAVCPGQTVVITGAGTVGQLCAQVAQEPGAGRVILADIVGRKLEMAAQGLGCDTFLINPVETPEQSFERLSVAMNIGDGVDAVVEASGAEKPVQIGNYTVKRGGTYVQIGVGKPKATIPILALLEKELLVRGSHSFVRE
ncbi:chaperonin 10-like protein [Aspergillus karnatakaensis]|uniref:chaperonin 10-like protein n=1 Tax=Aspergillus karnatakaensis TaxID=1810916 RepID=UPI003CCD8413